MISQIQIKFSPNYNIFQVLYVLSLVPFASGTLQVFRDMTSFRASMKPV